MRLIAAVIACAWVAGQAAQTPPAPQAPPPTDVFLLNLSIDRFPLIGPAARAINISNSPGYDNQPSFTPDSKSVLFTSNRDGKQTDTYRYDVETKALTQLTHTAESEYSPLVTPDGKTFSVIRVEADNAQRLWRFDMNGSNPRLVLENVKPVGYHAWIDATHIALFVLGAEGQPATLQVAETSSGTAKVVATNIGRSLQVRPRTKTLTFVSKASRPWTIKELDPATGTITDLAPALDGSEDFTWGNRFGAERMFMARDAKVFVHVTSANDATWQETGDIAGVASITRLAVRPEGQPALAFVAEPSVK
jgi:dipeptidyl aminopeptidase/acylaminoacyl peptidase